MALEIAGRDLAEHAGEAALDALLLVDIGAAQERLADGGAGELGHLLHADHEHDPGGPGLDRPQALVHGGRAGGAGVLDPGRGLEAQGGVGLEHERAGEVLRDEAAIEVAEPDLVDLGWLEPCVGDRSRGRLDDQALGAAALVLAERQMAPADDAGGHGRAPGWLDANMRLGAPGDNGEARPEAGSGRFGLFPARAGEIALRLAPADHGCVGQVTFAAAGTARSAARCRRSSSSGCP